MKSSRTEHISLKNTVASALLSLGILATHSTLGSPHALADDLAPNKIAAMLAEGGYIVYVRHTSTEKDYADQLTADVNNCSTQRTLSEKGWDEAGLIGASFNILKIPVGSIYSSEYCRAWKTARLAFGIPVKRPALNFEKAEEYTPEQINTMRDNVNPFLIQHPLEGTNTVIVGHDDPFEAATGIYPEPQGVAYVIKPLESNEFKIVGSIAPTQWSGILAEQKNDK